MKPHHYGPFEYSAIIDRPPLRWPNGAKIRQAIRQVFHALPLPRTLPGDRLVPEST